MNTAILEDQSTSLEYATVEKGLRELNPDITLDLGAKFDRVHPGIAERAGVYHKGKHICAIDRGAIPEFKIYTTAPAIKEIDVHEGLLHEDDPDYLFTRYPVGKGHTSYKKLAVAMLGQKEMIWPCPKSKKERLVTREADGSFMICGAFKVEPTLASVVRVGWRHTFDKLLKAKIPGITRKTLAAKFKVDMNKAFRGDRFMYEAE